MKFIVSSGDLAKKINIVSGVVGANKTLPILDNYLFSLQEGILTIIGSDGETTLSSSLKVESTDSGKIAVPARIFSDLIKTFTEQPLTISVENNQLEVIDESDNYFVALDDADEFPSIPEIEGSVSITLTTSQLVEAIGNTVFATGTDTMRPIMTGVLFQFTPQGTHFVATDAHRLVKYSLKTITVDEISELIIPKKPLSLMKNTLGSEEGEVQIEYNNVNIKFSNHDTQWVCRLIEGKYPNYEAVIPKDNPNLLTINKTLLLNSLKRASLFTNKSTNQLKLEIKGNSLNLSAEDIDFSNKAQMTIPCDYNGEDMAIGFNAKFLTEMVSNIHSEDIYVELSIPSKAGILKPVDGLDEHEELLMLVMPVMLNA